MARKNAARATPSGGPDHEPDPVQFIYSFDRNQIRDSPAKAPEKPKEAVGAIERLYDGNQLYADFIARCKGTGDPRPAVVELTPKEIGHVRTGEFPPQLPFAAVLGCVDARAPVELLFSQGFDSLYVMRIAGNTLGPDCEGSLHYALHSFAALKPQPKLRAEKQVAPAASPEDKPLRLVVVLGHADCGAVSAAVKTLLGEDGYRLDVDTGEFLTEDSVRGLLGRINVPAVRLAVQALPWEGFGRSANDRERYVKSIIELSVYLNAAWNAHDAQAIVDQYGIEPGRGVDVRYGVFDPRDFFVRSMEGYRFEEVEKEKTLRPPGRPDEFLGSPPTSLGELFERAKAMAEELRRQQATAAGKESMARYFRLG